MEKKLMNRKHLMMGSIYHYDVDLFRLEYEDGTVAYSLYLYNNDECRGGSSYTLHYQSDEEAKAQFLKEYPYSHEVKE